ncbi:MAG: SCO family protein [Meiothermus sp.]|uniref:SCO family protein n=1 Tax=Meiothermus sp. TaxID=1955249 RepID=UPI0025CCC649|nr:SCO family protein [Meiothermus sp.]MCS7059441.1 SCO family protein [Meiothermus sp.]MCS7193511.1 SCO family protein [Meiothermus sp.]MCX7741351.1 SCO family protein [Meiothermus sp.]MDW8091521.1 SCO family protein [Meiothermus sp.]
MLKKPFWIGLLVLLPLSLVAGVYLFARQTYQPYGTRLLNPRPVDALDFSLTAHDGRRRSLRDFEGKVVLIFFGFVNCPDVCPTTLLELSKVYKALTPAERERVQVLLISVDPERDTLERLASYVTFFDPSFIGLTGSPEEIAAVAKKYGVFYQKSNIKSPTEYNVDHTATVFALDPRGNLRLIYGSGKAAETDRVVRDVRWLLRG